jgi:hypothetical protein
MTARIINPGDLFKLNRHLHSHDCWMRHKAREMLKCIACDETTDLVVANIASRLARPVRQWAPDNSGGAA